MENYFKYLESKISEYLLTLDDTRKNDWYATDRNFASAELSNFQYWLEQNE